MYELFTDKVREFDRSKYNKYCDGIPNYKLTPKQTKFLNNLLDSTIENSKKNNAIIKKCIANAQLQEMARIVEVKIKSLQEHLNELTISISQFESNQRDEEAIAKLKTTHVEKIGKISTEISESLLSVFNNNDAYNTITESVQEMPDVQRGVPLAIALSFLKV